MGHPPADPDNPRTLGFHDLVTSQASSHLLIFFPGGGVPEGRVYGRRLAFVSVRTFKRHHHHRGLGGRMHCGVEYQDWRARASRFDGKPAADQIVNNKILSRILLVT